jgi:hypothetical protein
MRYTKFSILTITLGRYNRPINGRRVEWTQFRLPHQPFAIFFCTGPVVMSGHEYLRNFAYELAFKRFKTFLLIILGYSG